jgi:DNA-binding CsgD family transcriptional regulator
VCLEKDMAKVLDIVDRGGSAFADARRQAHGGAADLDEALSVTGSIYDAALDPALWPETLRRICEFVGGLATALASEDVAAGAGRFYYSWGDDPQQTTAYWEKYCKLNPILVPMLLLNVGDVRSASQLISRDQLQATRFYKEWLSWTGYGDNTFAVIEKSASAVTYLATTHDAHVWADPEPRRRMQLLVPHVRRAVAIGEVLQRHKIEAESLSCAVDALTAGVLLVGDAGSVVHAKRAARAMLAAGDMLYLRHGVLAVRGGNGDACPPQRALIEAIGGALRDDLVVGPHGVAIPLTAGGGDRYVAHVLPLTSGTRRKAARASRAGAAVFIHKAALGGLLPLEAMAQQFGLSPAELRVLAVVIEIGGSVTEVAGVLGLSEPTVKTHLRRLFDKTGTKRQADLVRLAAGYTSPLVGHGQARL